MEVALDDRLCVTVQGAVQGVGFRPFVYRLAQDLGLCGWVRNSNQGVFIEAEGPRARLEELLDRLEREKPWPARISRIVTSLRAPVGYTGFVIETSLGEGPPVADIAPDLATCPQCLREIFDPADRRFLYPFTNCTHCGPRYSIIEDLPYDRARTTMKDFAMCDACRAEYEDPGDRRFHAQPNACDDCGPHLELRDARGGLLAERREAMRAAGEAVRQGRIVALKGLGGFQLLVDARNRRAVRRLRLRKRRDEKPFAVMFPSLGAVREACACDGREEALLLSAQSPIVLLARRTARAGEAGAGGENLPCEAVAPGNPCLGVMLPYTPLHHILMAELGIPVVATSGNLSEEPIATGEEDALERLAAIADLFLLHDRPIARHVDDSVARVAAGEVQLLRRARGYAPAPLETSGPLPPLLAAGGHLKSTVAITVGGKVVLSQHIGDLQTTQAYRCFERTAADLQRLYRVRPARVACDAHPDYLSTQFARRLDRPAVAVQHHHAHVASCLAEHGLGGRVLGVVWDGSGYGEDGTVWGGEFLVADAGGYRRAARLRPFPLPGGDAAVREPRRAALGLLYAAWGDRLFRGEARRAATLAFSEEELRVFRRVLKRGLNAPLTSSAGRLFDAVAALTGGRLRSAYEGQAAMELEYAARPDPAGRTYPLRLTLHKGGAGRGLSEIDWQPMLEALLEDAARGEPRGLIAGRFHEWLAGAIVAVAWSVWEKRVVLTGGCFQNRLLLERTIERLRGEGFEPYWNRMVPANDGGLALGQIVVAAHQ